MGLTPSKAEIVTNRNDSLPQEAEDFILWAPSEQQKDKKIALACEPQELSIFSEKRAYLPSLRFCQIS